MVLSYVWRGAWGGGEEGRGTQVTWRCRHVGPLQNLEDTQGLDWCLGTSAGPSSAQSRLLVVPTHLQGPSCPETQGTEASHTWRLEHSGFFFSTLTWGEHSLPEALGRPSRFRVNASDVSREQRAGLLGTHCSLCLLEVGPGPPDLARDSLTRAEFEALHPGFQPSCSPSTPPPAHPPRHTVLFQLSFQKQLQLSAISSFLTRWSLARRSLHSSLHSWFHKPLTSLHAP